MRRLLIGCSLAAVLFAGLWAVASAAAPANFAGTWALDKTKSKDLPPQMANIDSLTLTVTQDAQQLTVDTKVVRKETADAQGGPPAGGPGGGRGRGMGMGMGMGAQTYKLDGSETTLDTGGRGTAITKAEWQNDGKTFEFNDKAPVQLQGYEVNVDKYRPVAH